MIVSNSELPQPSRSHDPLGKRNDVAGKIEITAKFLVTVGDRQKAITSIAGLGKPIMLGRVLKKQCEGRVSQILNNS